MSKNFGHSVDEDDAPATSNMRGTCTGSLVIGFLLLIPPLTMIGVVVCVLSGVFLLLSPPMAAAERNVYAQASTGNGCAAYTGLVLAILVGLTVTMIAMAVASGVVVAVNP